MIPYTIWTKPCLFILEFNNNSVKVKQFTLRSIKSYRQEHTF